MLFPGMTVKEYSLFRVTRDADLELRDLEADDLMSALEEGLRKRRMGGEVVRLEVSKSMSKKILNPLIQSMGISSSYNIFADSLNFSTIGLNARTKLFSALDLTLSSRYDPYIYKNGRRINQFEMTDKISYN